MKVEKINTTRVWIDDNFYIDITPETDYFNFWLYNKNIGNAMFMFGTACSSEAEAIELATANAHNYICMYKVEYNTNENLHLKCWRACKYFTVGNSYKVIEYKHDNYYIVLDDEKKEHKISIDLAIDYFEEVLK